MTIKLADRGTGYTRVLSEQLAKPNANITQISVRAISWWHFSHMCPAPTELRRHLTIEEQRTLQRALRRSVKIVHKASRK